MGEVPGLHPNVDTVNMEKLVDLPSVARLSKNVIRILGQNPGKYTLQGTNTYLVGQGNPYVLVDTGQGIDSYPSHLKEALQTHHDHINGLHSVLTLVRAVWNERRSSESSSIPFIPPRVHKIPLDTPDDGITEVLQSISADDVTPDPSGNLLHDLQEGQHLPVTSSDSQPAHLHVIHTPGHTPDSLCLYFRPDEALFTADTILGQGTAVFEDLGEYMSSLRKLLDFYRGHHYTVLYPAHGPEVKEGANRIAMYLQHRVQREEQIVKVLASNPAEQLRDKDTVWTTWDIVRTIYKDYPQNLWEPAAHSVDLHLRKLETEGRVRLRGGHGKDRQWLFVR
ncbi:unnamed protein product [Somion occarium]|uniref:Metallo-beta-lactamase domain-containing protein n=1 Tax=Somion occarium TaxID=3059160 RepID=A0ABP1D682_9APHY